MLCWYTILSRAKAESGIGHRLLYHHTRSLCSKKYEASPLQSETIQHPQNHELHKPPTSDRPSDPEYKGLNIYYSTSVPFIVILQISPPCHSQTAKGPALNPYIKQKLIVNPMEKVPFYVSKELSSALGFRGFGFGCFGSSVGLRILAIWGSRGSAVVLGKGFSQSDIVVNMGALTIRIGFVVPLYDMITKNPQNSIGSNLI